MNFSGERCPIPSCVLYEIRPWHTRFFSSTHSLPPLSLSLSFSLPSFPRPRRFFVRSVSVTRDSRLLGWLWPKLILMGIFMACRVNGGRERASTVTERVTDKRKSENAMIYERPISRPLSLAASPRYRRPLNAE